MGSTGSLSWNTTPAGAFFASKSGDFKRKKQLVNVGGKVDSGFRSIAAALIDLCESHAFAITSNQSVFASLYKQHIKYFPEHKFTLKASGYSERFLGLAQSLDRTRFIISLALTLRQMAVNEICSQPEIYRDVFYSNSDSKSPSEMRLATTHIDESAIAASARMLSMPIELTVLDDVKPLKDEELLAKRVIFNEYSSGPFSLSLQQAENNYQPFVNNPAKFALQSRSLDEQKVIDKGVEIAQAAQDPSMQQIMARIAADDRRIIDVYKQSIAFIENELGKNNIATDDLLQLYIESIKVAKESTRKVDYVGVENGSQAFFRKLLNTKTNGHETLKRKYDARSNTLEAELTQALARAISIGRVDPNYTIEKIVKSASIPAA
jgi:hypothetical protein